MREMVRKEGKMVEKGVQKNSVYEQWCAMNAEGCTVVTSQHFG